MVAARGRVHADLAEARDLVGRRDRAHLRERVLEERGLFVQSPRKTERLAGCPDRIREDLAIASLARDGDCLLELPLRFRDVVEDRDRRSTPHQKPYELGARSEVACGVDRAIELVHRREVRVEPKLDDRGECAR